VPERVDHPRSCTEFQYAVKLVQGQPPPLTDLSFIAPGHYFTATNLHNPSTCKTVTFRWKVALTDKDGQHDSTISPFHEASLESERISARVSQKCAARRIPECGAPPKLEYSKAEASADLCHRAERR